MAAAHAAAKGQAEPVPDAPEPLAGNPRDGMMRGREIAATYGENLARLAASIAFGEGTKSLHTRLQAAQLLHNMIADVAEPVPVPPERGADKS